LLVRATFQIGFAGVLLGSRLFYQPDLCSRKTMILNSSQSETLRDIRYLEMNGRDREIDASEAQELCDLALVEKQEAARPCWRLTTKGWKALQEAEERLSLLVSL
jgi:hypothetical protein